MKINFPLFHITGEKMVRMAYLAVVASHTVNGVAAIHSEIIKETIFNDFYQVKDTNLYQQLVHMKFGQLWVPTHIGGLGFHSSQ